MLVFGALEIVFSQIPNFHEIWWLSIVAAVMSFTYSSIGLGIGIANTVANGGFRGTIAGATNVTAMQKVWRSLQALGNIAFAFAFSNVLTEIQDTIKAPPPSESAVMKKATRMSVVATSVFYALCGFMGYAAFGNAAPDNLLTGFGFYEPFWLVDAANVAIAVHLVGAYQVFVQPIFAFVERRVSQRWPDSGFVNNELRLGPFCISAFRLLWRSLFVCFTTVVAMALPFFGVVVGLLGAISFWPLTVYLPSEMYIAQRNVRRGSALWIGLKLFAALGLIVSVAATTGSVAGFVGEFNKFRPFSG
uniref:Amino acid transporter transmembrane domain-containing protein n=2 Tax=Oryza brachyantha TaxID=4533 RepID=J3NC03_ORYBR